MGKKSVKTNKNIYQLSREELNLTRDQASELLEYISSDRIEKIESEKSLPHPEEVITMSECYKKPELCNYYCTHDCAIGEKYVNPIENKSLSEITIDIVATVNKLHRERERLIDIVSDGKIDLDEYEDFFQIKEDLEKISHAVENLKLLIKKMEHSGSIDLSKLEEQ